MSFPSIYGNITLLREFWASNDLTSDLYMALGCNCRQSALRRVLALCLLALLCVFSLPANAQQRELKSDATEQVDAVLLMDASGSMLITDPLRLRDDGVRLFAQFLKPGDRVGVVRFADTATVVQPLTPIEEITPENLSHEISAIESNGQYTDLLAGIKQAMGLLQQGLRKEAKPIIVLLSDGKMEPPPQAGPAQILTDQLIAETLPQLKSQGMAVYTLAFSDQADHKLLGQIAQLTDGVSWFTPTADKIHESYADLFLTVKKPQVIPLGGKAFTIDADVQEATFYVNREDGQEISITTPDNRHITIETKEPNIKWFTGQKFDVITITSPPVGSWQVQGISPQEGFATILTNLKLVTDWPVSIDANSPRLLQARLYEGQKPVVLPDMTGAIRYAFQITPTDKVSEPILRELLVDDGSNGDKIARDGIFSAIVAIDEPGEYRLRVLAKGPTFERQQQIPFRVKPEVIAIRIEQPSEEGAGAKEHEGAAAEHTTRKGEKGLERILNVTGTAESVIKVILSDEARNFKNPQLKLLAVDVQRNRFLLPAARSLTDPGEYEVTAGALGPGKYELQATLSSEGRGRQERKDVSRIVTFTLLSADSKKPTEEALRVVEKPKGPPLYKRYPIFELPILAVLIAGMGVFCNKQIKSTQGRVVSEVPDFPLSPEVVAGIKALQAKLELKEVDLNDPMFNEEAPAAGQGGAPDAGASTADAAAASTAAEAGEGGAEAPDLEGAGAAPDGEQAAEVADGAAAEAAPQGDEVPTDEEAPKTEPDGNG